MIESKIIGVRMEAISTTLPSQIKTASNGDLYYVASELQTTSDLGFDAAERLISTFSIEKEAIGILLFGSKTPDYRSPNTAAILQGRLELPIDCICFDTNVGSNGFIKMTQVAAALLAQSNTEYALLVVGDTPSKLQDQGTGVSFEVSDAATAVLLQKSNSGDVMEFSTYSSGAHYKASCLKEGGFRDFNANKPFDGSLSENYIVKSDAVQLKAFFDECIPFVEQFCQQDAANMLVHSAILKHVPMNDPWKEQRLLKADASELPLLLENVVHDHLLQANGLHFLSAGEGMALMCMSLNHQPKILPKNHTLDFFEDYKVSHEM